MKFITDKEQVKAGLIIFRRGDVGHDQYYCRVRIQNEDRYKTISLKTSDRQTALDDALEHYANIRIMVKHDVPVFNRPFSQVAEEYANMQQRRANAGEVSQARAMNVKNKVNGPLNAYVGSSQIHLVNRRPIKASSLFGDRSRIELHIKPLIGNRVVSQLKLADIERLQGDIAAGRTARARKTGRGGQTAGGIGVAARAISTLRSLFNHARRLGLIEVSPATGVRIMASRKLKRHLGAGEIRHLGKVMTQMEREGEHPTGLAAIRVMLLTGFRRMEVLAMRKEWVQPEDNLVRFPDTKSGPQMRVAGDAAMTCLEEQAMRSHSPFVFPADWGDGHFIGVVRVLDRVCARAGLEDVTPHTLRHSFASLAATQGFSELTISGLLGHAPRGVTQRYVHLDTALIIAADQAAAEIARLMAGGELRSVSEIKQARTLASLRAVA